jgi:hypothetical protein
MFRLTVAVTSLILLGAPMHAQSSDIDFQRMQLTLVAAQAAANHPGDESLACEALQKEFVAIVNGPAVQSHYAKFAAGAAQQKSMAATKTAAAPQTPTDMMAALAAAGGWASLMAAQMSPLAQAAQNLENTKRQMNDTLAIMPHLMRVQRIFELTLVRKCPWLQAPIPAPQESAH